MTHRDDPTAHLSEAAFRRESLTLLREIRDSVQGPDIVAQMLAMQKANAHLRTLLTALREDGKWFFNVVLGHGAGGRAPSSDEYSDAAEAFRKSLDAE